eukprot:gene4420-4674_t
MGDNATGASLEERIQQAKAVLKADIAKKDQAEQRIAMLTSTLRGLPCGLSEPLIDKDGFPRDDCDLFQVKASRSARRLVHRPTIPFRATPLAYRPKVTQSRHDLAYLQNDHKAMMLAIEKSMHELHSLTRQAGNMDLDQAPDQSTSGKPSAAERFQGLPPFASIGSLASVVDGSMPPAMKPAANPPNTPLAHALVAEDPLARCFQAGDKIISWHGITHVMDDALQAVAQ